MEAQDKVLGVAWERTHRRACLLDADGHLLRSVSDGQGLDAAGNDLAGSLAQLLDRLHLAQGKLILSGMPASRSGWSTHDFLASENALASLPARLLPLELPLPGIACFLVPGYRLDDGGGVPDVIRGEETLVFGARLLGAPDGWFLLPDTHSKWIRVAQGHIAEIVTFLTGELFGLLAQHGSLAAFLQQGDDAPQAFDRGVRAAAKAGLSHTLFGCRTLVLAEKLPVAQAASYVHGLLVGAELAEMRRRSPRLGEGQGITQVIGAPGLAARHVRALSLCDMRSLSWPADAAHAAALYELAGL